MAADRFTGSPLSVLLADGEPIARIGLRTLFAAEDGIRVLAEVGAGAEVAKETLLHRPDVLILDPRMPGLSGPAVIKEVRRSTPGTAVLVFTTAADDESVRAAVQAGAKGYLLKEAEPEEIVRAVRSVADGGVIFGAPIASRLSALLATQPRTRPAGPPADRAAGPSAGRSNGRPNGTDPTAMGPTPAHRLPTLRLSRAAYA